MPDALCTMMNLPAPNCFPGIKNTVLTVQEKETHWREKSLAVGCKWKRVDTAETKGRKEQD